jgi:hypothetical protein
MITMFDIETSGPNIMSSDNVKSVTRQRRPRGREFYKMTYDYNTRGNPDYLVENLSSLAPREEVLRTPRGRRGFPDYPEAPRVLFDKKRGRWPRDLELCHEYWLVSDRAKSIFETIDPAGFAFVACDVRLPHGDHGGPPFWLCDVIRVLDALDEARSRLKIRIREEERYIDFGKKYYSIVGGDALVFRDDSVGDVHVFRMMYMNYVVIRDQEMKDTCRAAGLKGSSSTTPQSCDAVGMKVVGCEQQAYTEQWRTAVSCRCRTARSRVATDGDQDERGSEEHHVPESLQRRSIRER